MRIHTLEREQLVPAPLEEVFAFFSEARNLERLTPSQLKFQVLTPEPIKMAPGTIIEYKLKLFGVPLFWRTEITVWELGKRFVDVQRKGPYPLWEHEHRFEERDGGTLMSDRLQYVVPGGLLAPLVHRLFVKKQVESIFDFRSQAVESMFKGGGLTGSPQLAEQVHEPHLA